MSTVAFRNGVMAADKMGVRGSMRVVGRKLYRVNDCIVGFSGNLSDGIAFVEWVRRGADREKLPQFRQYRGNEDAPDFYALMLRNDGLTQWTEHFQPIPIEDEFYALGSGAMAALAAMHMGADAAEAVRIAACVDINTGGEIMAERL